MAERHPTKRFGLQDVQAISARGSLWFDQPDEKGSHLGSEQHSRGLCKAEQERKLKFLGIARGSYDELQTQITIAGELGPGIAEELEEAENLSNGLGKMPAATIVTLKSQISASLTTCSTTKQ